MDRQNQDFLGKLFAFYSRYERSLPWREIGDEDPYRAYKILVSELMLQQTQVERVIPKYELFVKLFPSTESLAEATLGEVLGVWIGLGYNRRAKYLLEAAALLRGREFPRTVEELVKLKGVSRNTASAILTYAFNQKHIFVETNIRTVIIATFFSQSGSVEDKQIESKLEELLDAYSGNYCEFYWAIMDYGTYLKKQGNKAHQKSKLYKKQSSFPGSVRQLRGELLRRAAYGQSLAQLRDEVPDTRLDDVLARLVQEELVSIDNEQVKIA